jgi:hypothetical protein
MERCFSLPYECLVGVPGSRQAKFVKSGELSGLLSSALSAYSAVNQGVSYATVWREALRAWLVGTQTFKEKSFGYGSGSVSTGMKPGHSAKENSP